MLDTRCSIKKFFQLGSPRGHFLPLLAVLLVTFLAFSPALSNGFVNWDDPSHLLDNPAVRGLDARHLTLAFTGLINDTYNPLTSLSFAVEYRFFGYDPFVYHFNNLMLYLMVIVLVYSLFLRLGAAAGSAALATLIFALHPMHVESVAWVTERKDVLYAVFYLLAMLFYRNYLVWQRAGWLWAAVAAGLLSILAKPMAFSLPLILFLLDWFYGRKFSRMALFDKLPFFAYTFIIAGITYFKHGYSREADILQTALIGGWTFAIHLEKFFWPFSLSPYYATPQPVSFWQEQYFGAFGVIALVLLLLIRFRHNRWLIFALWFYFLSMLFLLRTDRIGENLAADRFMLLPGLGFCLLAGQFLDRAFRRAAQKNLVLGAVAVVALAAVLAALGLKTYSQCRVWKNSFTLWSAAIEYDHGVATAYNNRGNVQADPALAAKDYSSAIAIDPQFWEAYFNRGAAYYNQGKYELALRDYDYLLAHQPADAEAYYHRALIYRAMGKEALAEKDMLRAKQLPR